MKRVYLIVKRVLDVICSLLALVCLSPILIVVSLLIKMDSKGPVLFKQKRITKSKKTFMILKFRTMRTETPKDIPTHLLKNPGECITKVGRILRKTSLDELPQIINILLGDMSIVGPRPSLWNQYDLIYERDMYHANDILPGLTGWAQVNGRDELAIPIKAKLDGEYVQHMSFLFDVKIFFMTLFQFLVAKGIVEGNKT